MSKNNKKNKQKLKIDNQITIPDKIKVLYGKFFLFSMLYLLFFAILYPFFLVSRMSKIGSILIFVLLVGFYIYIIIDVLKHRENYNASIFVLLILLVMIAISFSIVKFLI